MPNHEIVKLQIKPNRRFIAHTWICLRLPLVVRVHRVASNSNVVVLHQTMDPHTLHTYCNMHISWLHFLILDLFFLLVLPSSCSSSSISNRIRAFNSNLLYHFKLHSMLLLFYLCGQFIVLNYCSVLLTSLPFCLVRQTNKIEERNKMTKSKSRKSIAEIVYTLYIHIMLDVKWPI